MGYGLHTRAWPLAILLSCCAAASGQEKYFVQFHSKQGGAHSIDRPEEFLSERALARRARQNIPITYHDLPVPPAYLHTLQGLGFRVHYPLRWKNGAVVELAPPATIAALDTLPFVSGAVAVYQPSAKPGAMPEFHLLRAHSAPGAAGDHYDYGASRPQVAMLNGHVLHNLGYRGRGKLIAVLDAGFQHANTLAAFDSLWAHGRVAGVFDVIDPQSNIFQEHSHGTVVLSAMAGHWPGQLVGTAPEAQYVLIRTENARSEQLIEEYSWARGAELADSLGADIINSSLGYYRYDVPTQSHSYRCLDGVTTPVTRAANQAMRVGMLVVTSAGNEGNSDWRHIVAPADCLDCLAVGAVTAEGAPAPFSSVGPTPDGRVKPDVVAQGVRTIAQSADGELGYAFGTSLAAPLISGLAACLWQALPHKTSAELAQLIRRSATQADKPNNQLGFGIPNFERALRSQRPDALHTGDSPLRLFPNPASQEVSLEIPPELGDDIRLSLISRQGAVVMQQRVSPAPLRHTITLPDALPSGLYLIRVCDRRRGASGKILVE